MSWMIEIGGKADGAFAPDELCAPCPSVWEVAGEQASALPGAIHLTNSGKDGVARGGGIWEPALGKIEETGMLDRRAMLGGGLSALAAAPLMAGTPVSGGGGVIARQNLLRDYLRITADASGKVALNYWRGAYLVGLAGRAPAIWFHLEGCEMRKCIPLGGNRYRSEYRLMTSVLDPTTDEILNGRDWTNPVTGKTVRIQPRTSTADTEIWQDEAGHILEQYIGDDTPSTLVFKFSGIGSKIYLSGYKHRESTRPSTSIDYGTIIAERADVMDGTAASVPSIFHSSFVAPLFRFLEMPDDSGQASWHVSGLKLAAWEEIPARHREQIGIWHPKAVEWAMR